MYEILLWSVSGLIMIDFEPYCVHQFVRNWAKRRLWYFASTMKSGSYHCVRICDLALDVHITCSFMSRLCTLAHLSRALLLQVRPHSLCVELNHHSPRPSHRRGAQTSILLIIAAVPNLISHHLHDILTPSPLHYAMFLCNAISLSHYYFCHLTTMFLI